MPNMPSTDNSSAQTRVDLGRVRSNAQRIRQLVGPKVELIAVVKADAYGLGAVSVADAIQDLVSAFYVFEPAEAVRGRFLDLTGKKTIAAVVSDTVDVGMLRANGIRPAVWTVAAAKRFATLDPLLSVDTGMQRFACPPEALPALFDAYDFQEVFTHGVRPEQAARLLELTKGRTLKRHAAASALLPDASTHLDAVRPGLALYEGAATVSLRLLDARDSQGPVGYTQFVSQRHGVIRAGYSNGLRKGPCRVNGRPQQIIEVGMQSAFVTLDASDRAGDRVTLLGEGLTERDVATAWGTSPQEALFRLASMGEKSYG
jgi:alanine racemase